jgi:hypothetical protein
MRRSPYRQRSVAWVACALPAGVWRAAAARRPKPKAHHRLIPNQSETSPSVLNVTDRCSLLDAVPTKRYRAERRSAAVLFLFAVTASGLVACNERSGDRAGDGAENGEALAATPRRSQQATPYVVRQLDAIGQIRGVVQIDGPAPADTVIQPSSDQLICGSGFTRRGIERRGNQVAGVVIWIEGLRSGKPLPLERRFEITSDRCTLVPEVQTAITGGTLNIRSLDAVEHRTRIVHRDVGEVLATIRETDEGQVVPNERVLARPGTLELGCEVHPWTRAWIAVFDHPYFTTSLSDGSFAIDSLPPGRYQIRAWHPRLGPVEDSVTVSAGQAGQIVLDVRAR